MKTYRTAAEIHKAVKDRQRVTILASTLQLEAEHKRQLEAQAAGDPYALLTNDELRELSRLEQKEAAEKETMRQAAMAVGTFMLSHSHFPANPQSAAALAQYCESRNLPVTSANLENAFNALVEAGTLVPNYSEANRNTHRQTVEAFKAQGLNIQAPPTEAELRNMPIEELEILARQREVADRNITNHTTAYANLPNPADQFIESLSDDEIFRRAGGYQ